MPGSYSGRHKVSVTHERQMIPGRVATTSIAEKVRRRTFELVMEIWQKERWKSRIANKISPYITTLASGVRPKSPQGVPENILRSVHRCFAQACLEYDVAGLNGQGAPWYEAAEAAAKHKMDNPAS